MTAVIALAEPAISSVLGERPPPSPRFSLVAPASRSRLTLAWFPRLTPPHASDLDQRLATSTFEPGTMSSAPSSQRTQALWPPS
jgi:hypothetical protein